MQNNSIIKIKGNLFLCCLLFLFGINNSYAQNITENSYANVVFNKLIKTINQSTPAKPQLIIIPSKEVIAKTNNNGEIIIGTELVEHCRSFGKDSANALAHILAHELTHYYSNHFWSENFGSAYADLDWGSHIQTSGKTLTSMKLYETQADEYGMYYAFAAGYKTLQIGSKVLDSIYYWYHLDDQLPGYPSLEQRKMIAVDAKQNITQMIPLFETGNLLLTLAQVYNGEQQCTLAQLSSYYYDDILANKIQTKELYNNAALTKVLQVLQYFDDSIQQIQFPFMLESKSILYTNENTRGNTNTANPETVALIETNLDEAEVLFTSAIKLDKNFYPAYINLAIVAYLKEKYGTAADYLSEAQKLMEKNHDLVWAVYEMQAIIEQSKDVNKMQTLFQDAINSGSKTALFNLQLLGNTIDPVELKKQMSDFIYFSTDTSELINKVPLYYFLDRLTPKANSRIDLTSGKAVLYIDSIAGYDVYYLRPTIKPAPGKLRLLITQDNTVAFTTKGLKLFTYAVDVEKIYGKPSSIILESNSAIWVYPANNLLIWITDEKVSKWGYWWLM